MQKHTTQDHYFGNTGGKMKHIAFSTHYVYSEVVFSDIISEKQTMYDRK